MKNEDKIEEILRANSDSVVVIDEAYIDFAAETAEELRQGIQASALNLLDSYENLLVVQTFSKSRAMAGMRIGMAFGQEKLIRYPVFSHPLLSGLTGHNYPHINTDGSG